MNAAWDRAVASRVERSTARTAVTVKEVSAVVARVQQAIARAAVVSYMAEVGSMTSSATTEPSLEHNRLDQTCPLTPPTPPPAASWPMHIWCGKCAEGSASSSLAPTSPSLAPTSPSLAPTSPFLATSPLRQIRKGEAENLPIGSVSQSLKSSRIDSRYLQNETTKPLRNQSPRQESPKLHMNISTPSQELKSPRSQRSPNSSIINSRYRYRDECNISKRSLSLPTGSTGG